VASYSSVVPKVASCFWYAADLDKTSGGNVSIEIS